MKREMVDTVDAALSRYVDDEPEVIELGPGETSLHFLRRVTAAPNNQCRDGCAQRSKQCPMNTLSLALWPSTA
jgi:hypothetical protein